MTKQDFVGVGGEHNSVIFAGHNFGVDVSVGSVVQMCEHIIVDRRISIGPVGQECQADEHICVAEQECMIGGEESRSAE